MNIEKAIEKLKQVIESNDELYNSISNGDITFTEAGDSFHSLIAYETIQALKVALEILRGIS